MKNGYGLRNQTNRRISWFIALVLLCCLVLPAHNVADANVPEANVTEANTPDAIGNTIAGIIPPAGTDNNDLIAPSDVPDETGNSVEAPIEETPAPTGEPDPNTEQENISDKPGITGDTDVPDPGTDSEVIPLPETPDGMSALAPDASVAAASSINVQYYYDATGQSTNDHFIAKGVYIDSDGNGHILLYKVKNENYQVPASASINEIAIVNPTLLDLGQNATFILPNGTEKSIGDSSVYRILDLNIGPVSILQAENTLTVLTGSPGWDIVGMKVYIDIDYSITKTVDHPTATVGDELIYTITVRNDGELPLSGIDVTDAIPSGTTVLGISADHENWAPLTVDGNVAATLDSGLSLRSGEAITYYVKVYVDENAENGTLSNTAVMGGALIPKEATAEVAIQTADVIVRKIVTGNIGDVSRKFSFEVTAAKGSYYTEDFSFDIPHNESFTLENLPIDAVLALAESGDGYTVTVTVDDKEISPNEDHTYTINVQDMIERTIAICNQKTGIIDTGILLDSLPYVLILMIVIAGIILILIRRRRIHREE